MRLLVNLPIKCDIFSLPYPEQLLSIKKDDDILLDLNRELFYLEKDHTDRLDKFVENLTKNQNEYESIIFNMNEYTIDMFNTEYIDYIMSKFRVPFTVHQKINLGEKWIIPTEYLLKYPRYKNTMIRTTMRITDESDAYYDLEYMIQKINYYYGQGVRFFVFTDDNIIDTNGLRLFEFFLERLTQEELKDAKFHVRNGFPSGSLDVNTIKLLKQLSFENIIVRENGSLDFAKIRNEDEILKENKVKFYRSYFNKFDTTAVVKQKIFDAIHNEIQIKKNLFNDINHRFVDEAIEFYEVESYAKQNGFTIVDVNLEQRLLAIDKIKVDKNKSEINININLDKHQRYIVETIYNKDNQYDVKQISKNNYRLTKKPITIF